MQKSIPQIGRYTLLLYFTLWYLSLSQLLRIVFFVWERSEVSLFVPDIVRTFITGLFYDLGTACFLCIPGTLYFTVWPRKWTGCWADRTLVIFFTTTGIALTVFSFFAEVTFWDEFHSRFNFIAVDYLIYTHEVIANINESYPLPLLIGGVAVISGMCVFLFVRAEAFRHSFSSSAALKQRAGYTLGVAGMAFFFVCYISNSGAEWSSNRYNSEISKSGIFSFFAAFRNNQMTYKDFYTHLQDQEAVSLVRSDMEGKNVTFDSNDISIKRRIAHGSPAIESKKNVIFILVESLSADFMAEFGNRNRITPFLDSLAQKSVFFSNLYATGTRTVRGMEAVTLSIPPTPGQSIVKRPRNAGLYTIGNVFEQKGYERTFFYGGDGYFDNMNSYFGGNGFSIYDRGHGSILNDAIKTTRHNIGDAEVTFENAWGICDGDLYRKVIGVSDEQYRNNQRFFQFVMTTSNHRPYTYPSGKIDIPSGKNRDGALKYTDYALKTFFAEARKKPWFNETVFVIIADHCASSAGKDEIDVAHYHIPAFIVNLPPSLNRKVDTQCSQIDILPTLFSLLHWNYDSDFFGQDVLASDFSERAFIGTYRKLGLMRNREVLILSDGKKQNLYAWNPLNNNLVSKQMRINLLRECISYYQTADYLFTHRLLR